MFKKILVPVDGSALATSAAQSAIALASQDKATLVLLNVRPAFPMPAVPEAAYPMEELRKGVEEHQMAESSVLLEEAAKLARAAAVSFSVVSVGDLQPWEAIVEVAEKEGCDLIVMGSHGRGTITGLLLGSQTNKVLSHTKIPVLVYR